MNNEYSPSDIEFIEENNFVLKISYNSGFKEGHKWAAEIFDMRARNVRPKLTKKQNKTRCSDIDDAIHLAVSLAKTKLNDY